MDTLELKTVDDVFTAFGGPSAVARALQLKRPSTASEMKRRRSIPVDYWRRIVDVAPDYGIVGLTFDKLVRMHTPEAAE